MNYAHVLIETSLAAVYLTLIYCDFNLLANSFVNTVHRVRVKMLKTEIIGVLRQGQQLKHLMKFMY